MNHNSILREEFKEGELQLTIREKDNQIEIEPGGGSGSSAL
jgi:hypothetical protein